MATINIDFSIHSSPYYLKVVDLSEWGLIFDKPSIIEITLPGYGDPITKFFDKEKQNHYNSNLLGTNCTDCTQPNSLPDGVYKIKVIGSPEKFNREEYYLKTDLFDMEVDKIVIDNIKKIEDASFNEKLTRIEFLKRGAEAHLRADLLEMAGILFDKAQDLVDDMLNCSNCK